MNDELSYKLIHTFPNVYSNKNPREPFNYDNAHFQCGDGWFKIIYDLSATIEQELLSMNVRERAKYSVAQVKEKFGTLRFYMTETTESMREAIEIAEMLSGKTCEECGESGSERPGRWISVRCDNCVEKK